MSRIFFEDVEEHATARVSTMKLSGKKQISYKSTPEIVEKLDFAAARLSNAKVKIDGGKLRTGHLVNAIALWVGRMDDDELIEFATAKIRALEAYLGQPDPDDLVEAVNGLGGADVGLPVEVRITQRPKPKRNRKSS